MGTACKRDAPEAGSDAAATAGTAAVGSADAAAMGAAATAHATGGGAVAVVAAAKRCAPAPLAKKKKATKTAKSAQAREQEIAALAAFADSDVIAPDDVLPPAQEVEAAASAARSAFLVNWTCPWCGCRAAGTVAKRVGPDGEGELCHSCAERHKQGFRAPRRRLEGGYQCQTCQRGCPTIAAFHAHAQLCDAVYIARHTAYRQPADDVVYFTQKIVCATQGSDDARAKCVPPPLSSVLDARIPQHLTPVILSLSENLQRFGPALALPHVSLRELLDICIQGRGSADHLDYLGWLSDELHLRLTMLVMELAHVTPLPNGPAYFRYNQKHFAGIGPDGIDGAAAVMQRCLDTLSWESVLWQYVKFNICDEYGDPHKSAMDWVDCVRIVGEQGYPALNTSQRVLLLQFLLNECLGAEYCRKYMLDNASALEDMDRKRREAAEAKRAEEKAFFQANPHVKKKSQLDAPRPEAKRRQRKKKPSAEQEGPGAVAEDANVNSEGPKGKRKALESMAVASGKPVQGADRATDPQPPAKPASANSKPRARRTRAPKVSSADDIAAQIVRAVVTQMVNKVVRQDVENKRLTYEIYEQEEMPIRLELLGEDREYNRYWWMASEPGKLWVETPTVGRDCDRFLPPARAYCRLRNGMNARPSHDARLQAATDALKTAMKSMGTQMLRDIAVLCKVPCRETANVPEIPMGSEKMYTNMTDKQLISAILKHDTTGVVTTAALELVDANALRVRIARAPRKQVVQLFKLHDIRFEPGMPRREMAKIPTWEQLQQMLVSELSDEDVSDDEPEVYVTLKVAPPEKIDEPSPSMPSSELPHLAVSAAQVQEVATTGTSMKTQQVNMLQPKPAGGDDGGDDKDSVDSTTEKKRKQVEKDDGETDGRQNSTCAHAMTRDKSGIDVTPTPMVAAPAAAPIANVAGGGVEAAAAAAPAFAPPAAFVPAATEALLPASGLAAGSVTPLIAAAPINARNTEKDEAQTGRQNSDSPGSVPDASKSKGVAALETAATSFTEQTSRDGDHRIDEKDVPLPNPLPTPPATVQIHMAKAYLKQVGLDAWYDHFSAHIAHKVKNVETLRSTTKADLLIMAEGANMMLDAATIDQVLNCLRIEPIHEIVDLPWIEWVRKERLVAWRKNQEQCKAQKTTKSQVNKIAAQKSAKEATTDTKRKHQEGRKKFKPDPLLPKKPKGRLSAYMYFSKAMRPSVVKKHPEMEKNVTAQGKLMGQMWRQLSDKQKEPYTKLAAEDAAREQKELEGYREEMLKARKEHPEWFTETSGGEKKGLAEKAAKEAKAKAVRLSKQAKGTIAATAASQGSAKSISGTKSPPKKRVRKDSSKQEKKTRAKTKLRSSETSAAQRKRVATTTAAVAVSKKAPDPLQIEARRVARHSAWPPEETTVLKNLVALQGEGGWTLKAHLLGTGRSPGQVKQHWIYLQAGKLKVPARNAGILPSPQVEEYERLLQDFRKQKLAKETAAEAAGEIRDLLDKYQPLENGGNPLPNELTEWGYYDSLEELHSLLHFLEPRGYKERRLLIRMRRILPFLAGAMATGRQIRCEAKGVGTIMGVDTEEFDSSTSNGSANCDVAAGVALTDVRGLRLSIRYLDHSTALMSMANARARLLPIDVEDAARAIANPFQEQARRSAANAAAKNAVAAIRSATTLGHLTKNQRPGLTPCHPTDICVARENAVCAKTGRRIVAWVDLIAWARETNPNPLNPNAPGNYSTFLVCHAANRSDPWPEPDLKAKLGKRNKAKVDIDDQDSTERSAKATPRAEKSRTTSAASSVQTDAASLAAAKAYELVHKADKSKVADEEEEERRRRAEEKRRQLASRPDPERFCGRNKAQERFPHCIGILKTVGAVVDEVSEREKDYEKRRDLRKKMTTWKKSVEKARSLTELPCAGLAALMVEVGKLLRKPRDGHESWEDWHACWEQFCKTITSESATIFAVYALRERALLLGLQPTKGASTFSLPDAKPTPRPRADAAESMLPLTEDLPQLTLLNQNYTLNEYAEDDAKHRGAATSAAAVAAAAAAAAAVAALDPSKPLPKLKARSHKKKKPEELLVNMTDEQRAEHEKRRAIEKALRLAAQAQAAGADLKDLKLPASLEQTAKPKKKKISRALTIPKRPAGKDREENRRIAKKEKERLAAMDKLVGAGPIDHATNALWTQEITKILTREDAYIFAEPVDRKMYPEYYKVIKRPMDFGTILENLRAKKYPSAAHIYRDVDLIFSNCKAFNTPNSEVGLAGRRIQSAFSRVVRAKLAVKEVNIYSMAGYRPHT